MPEEDMLQWNARSLNSTNHISPNLFISLLTLVERPRTVKKFYVAFKPNWSVKTNKHFPYFTSK